MLNLGVNVQRIAAKGNKGNNRFTPRALFASGEAGVWYDPSDLTTMFQDYTSAAPAVIGQPVGTILDKSKDLAQGAEEITNGDFSNGLTGWVTSDDVSIVSGSVHLANTWLFGAAAFQDVSGLTVGKFYKLTLDTEAISGNSSWYIDNFLGVYVQRITSDQGRHSYILQATATSFVLAFKKFGAGVVSLDNVSVTEIQGSHATQTTSVKRPVLARHPEGGIRNLLSYTQEFDDAYWTKRDATVTANQIAAPDGTNTGYKVNENAATAPHYIYQTGFTFTLGEEYTQSVYAKAGTHNIVQLLGTSAAFGHEAWANFDLSDGTIGSKGTATAAAIQSVGEGWYRCSITITVTATSGGSAGLTAFVQTKTSSRVFSYEGNPSNHIYAWGAQLEEGSTATQYQHVTDDLRYDITEPFGANSLNYLKFDGVSDGMKINHLTSPNTPLTAWFGYSATNAEASRIKYLLDIETGRTIFAASANVAGKIGYYDGAWSDFAADSNALKVLTYDLVEDNAKIRIDGTQEYSDTTYDQQAIGGQIGLFANDPLTGQFLAGNLYSCILRAAESTDKEIASTESYVAKKTGISL